MEPMPSWNIHIAHVQRLLHEQDARALGICDANAFLFGNLVPDVYVGYLVRPTSRTVPYRVTSAMAAIGRAATARAISFFIAKSFSSSVKGSVGHGQAAQ